MAGCEVVEEGGSGLRRPELEKAAKGIYQSAEIGKISTLETRLCTSRWTICSGHTWDVLSMQMLLFDGR